MAEKRKFALAICVKIDAKTAVKIELFDAVQWSESAQGRYRCRVNRRWHDLPDGGHAYLDMRQIMELAVALAQGGNLHLAPMPRIPYGTAVSLPNGNVVEGVVRRDVTRTMTPPIRGHDGRWYVGVLAWGGTVLAPVDDLIILPPKLGGKRRVTGRGNE